MEINKQTNNKKDRLVERTYRVDLLAILQGSAAICFGVSAVADIITRKPVEAGVKAGLVILNMGMAVRRASER